MSLVLLVAAGLFINAQLVTFRASPGFETRHVLAFSIRPPMPPYTNSSASAFYQEIKRRLQGSPASSLSPSPVRRHSPTMREAGRRNKFICPARTKRLA